MLVHPAPQQRLLTSPFLWPRHHLLASTRPSYGPVCSSCATCCHRGGSGVVPLAMLLLAFLFTLAFACPTIFAIHGASVHGVVPCCSPRT
eukprot:2407829-Amphidinium_carterae.2